MFEIAPIGQPQATCEVLPRRVLEKP
jgi:hypothetical protein